MTIKKLLRAVTHPGASALTIMIGVLIGLFAPQVVRWLEPIAQFFLAFLKMCAIPIVLTALVTSFANLLKKGEASQYFQKIIIGFFVGAICASAFGALVALSMKYLWASDETLLENMAKLVASHEVPSATGEPRLKDFVLGIIPQNIFQSLTKGDILAIIVFSVLLGMSIGHDRKESGHVLLTALTSLKEAFLE